MAAARHSFTLVALVSLLTACGSDVRWTKPDTDELTMESDMAACRKQAQAMYGGAAASLPPVSVDPRFGPTGPTQTERAMQEGQAIANCMRGKGYTLITVEKK